MKYLLSTIAIASIIISCSHGKTSRFPEGKGLNNPVEVTIIRNKNLWCGAQSTAILLDEVPIAHIRTGEYVSFFVESGVHYLRVRENGVYGNFEKEKKYYFLISINFFDIGYNMYTGDSCGFEIEKISEEEGLKRVKKSKNLIEMEEPPKSVAKVAPTKTESKKVSYTFNPEEPWTGTWEVESTGAYGGGQWVLKQQGNKVKTGGDSRFDDLIAEVKGNELKGIISQRTVICPIKLKISEDGKSFEGTFIGFANRTEWLKGKRK